MKKEIEIPKGIKEELLDESNTEPLEPNRKVTTQDDLQFREALKYSNSNGEFELFSNSVSVVDLARVLLELIDNLPDNKGKKKVRDYIN